MAQKESRKLLVEDGWLYSLHGWTQVIVEVPTLKSTLRRSTTWLRLPKAFGNRWNTYLVLHKG